MSTFLSGTTTTRIVGSLNRTTSALNKTINHISSGSRINRAADDASQSANYEQMRAKARSLRMAERNAYQGVYAAQIADGATSSVTDSLKRLRELAVQSSSATLNDDERAYIDAERIAMVAEIDRVATNTNYNGIDLANGSTTSLEIQVGSGNTTNDRISITLGDLRSATLGVDSVDLSTETGAQASLDALDDAIQTTLGYRSSYGTAQSRFEFAASLAINQSVNADISASAIGDADFAYEASEMARLQIVHKAGVAALGQAKRSDQVAMRGLLGR